MPAIASSKRSFRVEAGPESGHRLLRSCTRSVRAAALASAIAALALIAAPASAQELPERTLSRIISSGPDPGFPEELDPQAQGWVESRDFARIDALHARYLAQAERTANGDWKSQLLADALMDEISELKTYDDGLRPDWPEVEAITLRWARAHRDSALARILHAWAMRGRAQAATVREDRGYYSVSAKHQPKRDALMRRAMDYLQGESRVASRDPEYAVLLMATAASLDDYARVEAIFDQAMTDSPDYFVLYSAMLGLLREDPKTDAVERYARRVLSRHRTTVGPEVYARLYALYAEDLAFGPDHLFAGTQAKWADMRAGFEDWTRRYPSQDNLQTYARYACIAGDLKALSELWPRLQAPNLRLWKSTQRFQACSQLAGELQPIVF